MAWPQEVLLGVVPPLGVVAVPWAAAVVVRLLARILDLFPGLGPGFPGPVERVGDVCRQDLTRQLAQIDVAAQ